jgi:DNA ligase D-like protein (predicted 3'-phosphoesterase)
MSNKETLKEYRQKRDFNRTPEPQGRSVPASRLNPIFVIQKHAASSLHYDFRLEIGGILVSWAVPKGPSLDPQEKRLAMQTEDHPLEYARFEGIIPEGEYGAGAVIVWDTGTFRNLGEKDGREISLEEALENGHLTFWLEGKKLQGGFALTKFGKGKKWLLVKMKDEKASPHQNIIETKPQSVLSGKTVEKIGSRVG